MSRWQRVRMADLIHFAVTCDAARATASKLAKTTVIADYLRTLPASDLPLAAGFLAAQPFPPSSGMSLGVGGALVIAAVRDMTTLDRAALSQAFREHGEIGEAISPFWPTLDAGTTPLTLEEVRTTFHAIAATGAQDAKRQLLGALLRRATNREAVYLLKMILGDMRTGVSEGIVESAIAEAFGEKVSAIRAARLLVGDLDAVASLAFAKKLADAAFRPFIPLGYMLAQPIMTTTEILHTLNDRPAIAEDKFDGIRAQLHAAPNDTGSIRIELFSRGSGSVAASFPDITGPAALFAQATQHRFVLDGEIVPLQISSTGEHRTLPFSILQKRLGRKQLTPKQLRENPCAFVAFDCLWLDGQLLLNRPLAERREHLTLLLPPIENQKSKIENTTHPPPPLPFLIAPHHSITTAEALDAAFAAARLRRNEGLVIKRLDSLYTPGRRGDAWLKLKSHLPTLDVIVTAAELGHGKRRGVLSDVTFAVRTSPENPALLTVGKAYTGLTDAEIAALTERFNQETLEVRGRLRIVRPSVVLEIAFDQLTKSDRHPSGYAMRFPRIVRIREDKTLTDIDTLDRVRQIYLSPDNLALGHDGEKLSPPVVSPDQLSLF
jgi:DNA ligase-1